VRQFHTLSGLGYSNNTILCLRNITAKKISNEKDIIIPEVENVFVAAVQEWSDDFMEKVWYAYLVNDSDFIESVMVVSNWNHRRRK
jgi:hypothetical protein